MKEIHSLASKLRPNEILNKEINGLNLKFGILHPRLKYYVEVFPEDEVLKFIDHLSPQDCLIDLGAAEGRFAVYAAKKGILTWAIEPDAHNFLTLKTNQDLNCLNNLHSLQIAISKSNGKAKLRCGQPYPGGHQKVIADCSGRNDLSFHFSETQEVEIMTYDSLIREYQIKPTALKIDIDGSELDFFTGVKTLDGIKHLMIELCTSDPYYSKLLKIITGFGFSLRQQYPIVNEKNLYNAWFDRFETIEL